MVDDQDVRDTWRQVDAISLLAKHKEMNPLSGGRIDVAFTAKKIFFIAADEISKRGPLVVGGAVGVALAQAVVDIRRKLQERKLRAGDLEALVENGVALSMHLKDVTCEVVELKKDWYDRLSINSTRSWAIFDGPLELRSDSIGGRVAIETGYSREKARRQIENVGHHRFEWVESPDSHLSRV